MAQPSYFQVGGINNPARTMQVSVNGQPNTNTTFRLDGMTVTNQWIPGLQAYGPAIEAIETVNVVTSNFEADQGMAGGAAVNVQVKSGTNNYHGSAFDYFTELCDAGAQLLPSVHQRKAKRHEEHLRRHGRRTYQARQAVLLRQHRDHGFQGGWRAVHRVVSSPEAVPASDRLPRGKLLHHGHADLRPGHGQRQRHRPYPVRICQLSRVDLRQRPGVRGVQLHPGQPSQPGGAEPPRLHAANHPGTVNNYVAAPPFTSLFYKIDTKLTWVPSNRVNVNARVSGLHDSMNSAGLYGDDNPLSLGTDLSAKILSYSPVDDGDPQPHVCHRRRWWCNTAADLPAAERSAAVLGGSDRDSEQLPGPRLGPAADGNHWIYARGGTQAERSRLETMVSVPLCWTIPTRSSNS